MLRYRGDSCSAFSWNDCVGFKNNPSPLWCKARAAAWWFGVVTAPAGRAAGGDWERSVGGLRTALMEGVIRLSSFSDSCRQL